MFLQGEAASEVTKTLDDKNPNYCSLQNLIDGAYPGFPLPVYAILFVYSDDGFLLRKRSRQRRRLQTVQQQVDLSWV